MNIYTIEKCKEGDLVLLIDFIKNHWKKDHIFVKSEELLRFQHFNIKTKEFNFLIAKNNITNQIDGVNGLIPLSHYDSELVKFNDTWGGIWKVRSDVKNNEIGLLGLILFEEFQKYDSHGGAGLSDIAAKLIHKMRYNVCIINQYYILNDEVVNFKIASVPEEIRHMRKSIIESKFLIKKIHDVSKIKKESVIAYYRPYKSLEYLINRFQKHPIYNYSFFGIYNEKNFLQTIIVIRAIEIKNSKVLRIVDVLGSLENLGSLKFSFLKILKEESAEYIDFCNFGISPEIIVNLGFEILDINSSIIIPNYFEPFVRENIVIRGCYKAKFNYTIFKADADQDRPSLLQLI
jgi:hypothetical protein